MKNNTLFVVCLFMVTTSYAQESHEKIKLGLFAGAFPVRFSRIFMNAGATIDKPLKKRNGAYWSSSLNYSDRRNGSESFHESVSLCTGYSTRVFRGIEKVDLVSGVQIGYLYKDRFKNYSNRSFVNAAFLRFSGEVCLPLKSFELGLIGYFGMGFGYRHFVSPLSFDGFVVSDAFGIGIILKYSFN